MITPGIPEWPEIPTPLLERNHNFDTRGTVTVMESGRVRVRRNEAAPRELMNVEWNFTDDQFETFQQFFSEDLEEGTLSFSMVTYDPSGTEGYVNEVTRELVFFQPKYQTDHSDSVISVSSVLEVLNTETTLIHDPPLPLVDEIPFQYFDGPVYAISAVGDVVYVSGRFTSYGSDELGWTSAKAVCRILKTGYLDTSFAPGGVAAGGFDIIDGYFAPTQIQPAIDGGVFIGFGFAYFGERNLYLNRLETGKLDRMSLNGVEVPPVIKLHADGTRDTSFVSNFLMDASTMKLFMGFHMYEQFNKGYYALQEDIEAFSESDEDASGTNCCSLQLRTLNGTPIRRMHRIGAMGAAPESFYTHQVVVDLEVQNVYWAGQNENAFPGKLYLSQADDFADVEPVSWLTPDALSPLNLMGVLVLDISLNLNEAGTWAVHSRAGFEAGRYTTMVPNYVTYGCFLGSIVGHAAVYDGALDEGRYGASEAYAHKGVCHVNLGLGFGPHSSQHGAIPRGATEAGGEVTSEVGFTQTPPEVGSNSYLMFYGGAMPSNVALNADPGGDNEGLVGGNSGIEDVSFFDMPPDYMSGTVEVILSPASDISLQTYVNKWKMVSPAFRPIDGEPQLWDLRSGGDMSDPTLHGFSPFTGIVVDNDGSENVRVLRAMHDGSTYEAAITTSPDLGVFVTGMIEKFKGNVVATVPGQLFKIRHDGDFIGTFVPPIFGPESFNLKKYIATGADELHYQKLMCATISSGGNVLYVGGKFTELTDGAGTRTVGHICCLDINTGEIK